MRKPLMERLKDAIHSLEKSRDMEYTEKHVSCGKDHGFSVECSRIEDDDVFDEDGNLVYERKGRAIGFQVYYQENGKDVDCCSLSYFSEDENMRSLEEFVKIYAGK